MLPYFFGYGSLVNTATHDYPDVRVARLSGWRRQWRHTALREVAYLSVHPVNGAEIDGLIAHVPGSDWAALDQREAAYDRLAISREALRHDHPDSIDVHLYCTRAEHTAAPSVRHPILMSYLDTVACGYHQRFGQEGMADFFATTDGWDAPILDDRRAPIYPRATSVSQALRREIDAELDARGVKRLAHLGDPEPARKG